MVEMKRECEMGKSVALLRRRAARGTRARYFTMGIACRSLCADDLHGHDPNRASRR